MFMDFKFFDEVVQAAEEQRTKAVAAWERAYEKFNVMFDLKPKKK